MKPHKQYFYIYFRKIILLFFIPCFFIPTKLFAQAGFEEEILPNIKKTKGNIKTVNVKFYYPTTNYDSLTTGLPTFMAIYEMDNLGRIIKETEKGIKEKRYPMAKWIYKYWGRDSVIRKNIVGRYIPYMFKTINFYDAENQLERQGFFTWQDKKFKFLASVTNYYDSSRFLIKQIHKGTDGQSDIITEYQNDERGNHLQIKPPSLSGESQYLEQRNYIFDEHDNPIATHDYTWQYKYDHNGNWIKLTKYMKEYSKDINHGLSEIIIREITYY